MSNALAIATVTGTLRARLRAVLNAAGLDQFAVSTAPPGPNATEGVYLHLFQVLPNRELRNDPLPERRGDGTVANRPRLAVRLAYLVSFVGGESNHDPERLAGLVLTNLHEAPILSRDEIDDFVSALNAGHPLVGSDLAQQAEAVRLTLQPLDLETLSRLWGMYGRATYHLSVAVEASVVLLDAQVDRGPRLPVRRAVLTTFPLQAPRIDAVRSSARDQPIVAFGEDLVVIGQALAGTVTVLRVGERPLPVPAPEPGRIAVAFDAASGLAPGVVGVQVVHRVPAGEDGPLRDAARSAAVPVALVPTVAPAEPPTAAGVDDEDEPFLDVRLDLAPEPAPGDDLELLLAGTGGEGLTTWGGWRAEGGTTVFRTRDLAAGTYLARVAVAGATSLLDVDEEADAFSGPAITVP